MADKTKTLRKARFREKNNNWRGGKSIASNGYVLIRVGTEHRLSDVRGYAYEHRIVAEAKVGRCLRKGELVHHIDGNKQNNDPENLEVCESHRHHLAKHRKPDSILRDPGEANSLISCKCGCGSQFEKFDPTGRPRIFISGHNTLSGVSLSTEMWDVIPPDKCSPGNTDGVILR